jgi:hypothetical protein
MSEETAERRANRAAIAERHGVSVEAVQHLVRALETGHGNMAQFDHPEFGGLGQWSRGGMIMVGRMNDHALKARVDALCTELAAGLPLPETHGVPGAGNWWPDGLGVPSSVGAQDGTRYAVFPASRRLAVETRGRIDLYDLGDREVTGVSQQQSGDGTVRFSGPAGGFALEDLIPLDPEPRVAAADPIKAEAPEPASPPGRLAEAAAPVSEIVSDAASRSDAAPDRRPAPPPITDAGEVLTILERLAELRRKDVLTDAEFSAKKAELLARL